MQSEFVLVYSTFPDESCARRIAEVLVRERLAACVNIYPPMISVYEWQGKVEAGAETAALIKTRRTNIEAVVAAARPLHPYAIPCFLVLPIEAGNADYLDWVRDQTRSGPKFEAS